MDTKSPRIIMHIDMNSYFASCEQQDNLAWRGKPLGVCEHLGGIIIAASVEAKQWGIKTGTPVWEARRLFPKIILTQTNPARYRKYTARFLKVFADYTDKVEKYSIDEAFLDLTKACCIMRPEHNNLVEVDPWQEAEAIAKEIKRRMKREVGDWIRCSVGVADNKLLAKIGSDMQKPDGLTVIKPEDREKLYDKLELIDIPGIGQRMKKQLQGLGINTLRQLRDYSPSKLVAKFGIMGFHLHRMGQLQGSWKEDFGAEPDPIKSIGHMYTMPKEYRQRVSLEPVLYKLSEMVGARLRVNGLMGNIVSVHIHDAEYNCASRSERLGYLLDDGRDLYLEAIRLLNSLGDTDQPWRKNPYLIGVTVAGVQNRVEQQSLFQKDQHHRQLVSALDRINAKYDDFTIARVPAFLARDIIRDSIGFGRMKEFKASNGRGSRGRFS